MLFLRLFDFIPNSQGNVLLKVILGYHGNLITQLDKLMKEWNPSESLVGKIFKVMAPFFKIYFDYSNKYCFISFLFFIFLILSFFSLFRYSEGIELYHKYLEENKQFPIKLQELREASGQTHQGFFLSFLFFLFILFISIVPDILIMPIQRIPRYSLLLNDLLKHTPQVCHFLLLMFITIHLLLIDFFLNIQNHPDYHDLSDATAAILVSANLLNEQLRKHLQGSFHAFPFFFIYILTIRKKYQHMDRTNATKRLRIDE